MIFRLLRKLRGGADARRALIDLHLHTTASDGRCSPRQLVKRAAAAGLTMIAVTDHDTTASTAEVRMRARKRGIDTTTGIEVTAVEDGRDIHVLGYFLDPENVPFVNFLSEQRRAREARVLAIGERLAALGMPIDLQPLLDEAQRHPGRSIGRPQVARAMVSAGYVATMEEAFDRWLGQDSPAFVVRLGASPEAVVSMIHRAGGLASLAHPGRTMIDARIPALRDAGLDAIEVYHIDHDEARRTRYRELARDLGLLVTGGSDFHGDPAHGFTAGAATLPIDEWERLEAARHRHAPQ